MHYVRRAAFLFSLKAQSKVGGGCDDPDCDCGGRGTGDHDGGVAMTGYFILNISALIFSFSCGTTQFKTILDFIESMEDEMGSLTEKVEDLSASYKVHEERCFNDDVITTNKLNAMNDKVLEIRQLVGVNALSKGLASFKIINEMKRNAIIDENGFMVPLEDQKTNSEVIEEKGDTVVIEEDNKRKKSVRKNSVMPERMKSPKKPTAPKMQSWEVRDMKRKESLKAKGDDPTHNWKILSETIGFNGKQQSVSEERDQVKNGKDTSSSTGSDGLDDGSVERPRAARSKTRTRSVSPRKRTRSPTKKLQEIKRRISSNEAEGNGPEVEKEDRMDVSSPEN